jgi:hypothetical protein
MHGNTAIPAPRKSVHEWIILKRILQKDWDVKWTEMAQERGQWRDFVNSVLNLNVP